MQQQGAGSADRAEERAGSAGIGYYAEDRARRAGSACSAFIERVLKMFVRPSSTISYSFVGL